MAGTSHSGSRGNDTARASAVAYTLQHTTDSSDSYRRNASKQQRPSYDPSPHAHNSYSSAYRIGERPLGMPRALLKLAKRSLPMIMLRGFELLVNNSMVRVV